MKSHEQDYWERNWVTRFGPMNPDAPSQKIENEKKEEFITHFTHLQSGTLMDGGCGFGSFVRWMRRKGWDAVGVDVSNFAVNAAVADIKPYLSVEGLMKLGFESDSFDVVTAFDVLEHIETSDIFAAVAETVRVSKQWVIIKLPADGFCGEQGIPDRTWDTIDDTHFSIFPWEFWARRFEQAGARFFHCAIWDGAGEQVARFGECMEVWMVFKKKRSA